jgi:hypothetical protein
MKKSILVPTHGFVTIDMKKEEEALTVTVKSCIALVVRGENGIVTLAHISDFAFSEELLKYFIEDILLDFQ